MASSSSTHRDELDEDKEESPVISVDTESSGIPKHDDLLQNFSDTSELKPGPSVSKTSVHSSDPTDSTTSSAIRSSYVRTAAPDLSKRKANAAGLRLPEPWRSLIETAKALHLGKNVDISPMPDISHLSTLRQSLFKCAYDNLRAFKSDRKLAIHQKDAHLNITEDRTSHVLKPLQEILERNGVEYLRDEVCILKGKYQQQQRQEKPTPLLWRPILGITEHLCQLVLRPSFGSDPSEADVVDEWKAVFNHLLEGGECVSDSSKKVKSILDEEFDEFGKFGRKIDLTFYSGEYELENCEFKLPGAPDIDVKIQNRKNIRLNRAIMESHLEASDLKLNVLYFDYQ
ncbi:hypothetical protein BGZ79_004251, partial [Entomortierella chlamydospora]